MATVLVGGKTAWVYGDSSTRYDIQIPVDAGIGPTIIQVGQLAQFPVILKSSCPSLFSTPTTSGPLLFARHASGGIVTALDPAAPGERIRVVAAGLGPTDPPVGTGAVTPMGLHASSVWRPEVTVGGETATVASSELRQGERGFFEIVAEVPGSLPPGLYDVEAAIGGVRSNALPLPVGEALAVAPATGGALSQTFTFAFFHGQSPDSLTILNVLINRALDGRRACYLAFDVSSRSLILVNDSGDAGGPYAGSLTLPGPGVIFNSQCAISGVGTGFAVDRNSITLTLNVTFAPTFGGGHIVYMASRDRSLFFANTGWRPKGAWRIPAQTQDAASVSSISPARATSRTVSLTGVFTDNAGFAALSVLNILINNAIDGRGACYIAFVVSDGSLFLVNDAGDGGGPFAGSLIIPGAGSAANSQCTVSGAGSSVVKSGNTVTLTLNMTFSPSFAGDRVVYAAARDNLSNNSGWQALATIAVP
ncbi:MAG: hypothetical protein R2729_30095 [Bryobacteraceae bacterium]